MKSKWQLVESIITGVCSWYGFEWQDVLIKPLQCGARKDLLNRKKAKRVIYQLIMDELGGLNACDYIGVKRSAFIKIRSLFPLPKDYNKIRSFVMPNRY